MFLKILNDFFCSYFFISCSRMPCNTSISEWEQPDVSSVVQNILQSPEWNQQNPSPSCQCSTDKKLTMMPICPAGAGGLPPRQRVEATGDVMLDLTNRNISDYLVKTYPSLIRTRQVGMSFMFKSCGLKEQKPHKYLKQRRKYCKPNSY